MNDSWVPFIIGIVGAGLWTLIIMRTVHRLGAGATPPCDARIATVATATIVALCLTVAALSRTDAMGLEEGRVAVDTARLALLAGAVLTIWTSRTRETK